MSKLAIKTLYKLSLQEGTIGNKAKEAFVESFKPFFAETILSFDERKELFDELKESKGLNPILVKSLGQMLKASAFTRFTSGNDKGLPIYHNEDPKDLLEYYRFAIQKLKTIITENGEHAIFAKKVVWEKAFDQLDKGDSLQMLNLLKLIVKQDSLNENTREHLIKLVEFDYPAQPNVTIELKALLEANAPNGVEEELKNLVANAPWINDRDADGNYVNVAENKAISLAEKYLSVNENLEEFYPLLLNGEQRQSFAFGQKLGKDRETFWMSEIVKVVDALKDIPLQQQNSNFLFGIVKGIDTDEFTRLAMDLALDEKTWLHGVGLSRLLKNIESNDLEKIKPFFNNPEDFRFIEYLDISLLAINEIIDFANWVNNKNKAFALEMLFHIIRKDEAKWSGLKDTINGLLFVSGVFSYRSFIGMGLYVKDLFEKSINDNPSDESIEFLVNEILEAFKSEPYRSQTTLRNTTYFLLENQWDKAWHLLGDKLAMGEGGSMGIRYFLKDYRFNNSQLLEWAKIEPETKMPIAMRYIDLFEITSEVISWSPVAKEILDNYADNREVLGSLSGQLFEYQSNQIPRKELFIQEKGLVKELLSKGGIIKEYAEEELKTIQKRIEEEEREEENRKLRYD